MSDSSGARGGHGLHVAMLCAAWRPACGGVETHSRELALALLHRGWRVSVLVIDPSPREEEYSQQTTTEEGLLITRVAYRYGDHQSLDDIWFRPRGATAVADWLAERKPNLVHVQHLTGFGLEALAAIECAALPCVMSLHDYWSLCPRGQMLASDMSLCTKPEPATCADCQAQTWPHLGLSPASVAHKDPSRAARERSARALELLALPQALLCPSLALLQVYVAAGIEQQRLSHCQNGIAHSGLREEVARLRAKPSRASYRLGILGSVQPSKGVLELAQALLAVPNERLSLHVHGPIDSYHGDCSYGNRFRRLAQESERIHWHGPYDHQGLASILAGLDAVAAPSIWQESFGLTVREASAAGLPVFLSDMGGLPEALAGSAATAGRVLPAGDWQAWSAELEAWASGKLEMKAGPLPRGTAAMVDQIEEHYRQAIERYTSSNSSASLGHE